MSKKIFSPIIEMGEFLILPPSAIDSFMLENEFSEKIKKQILKICKEFNGSCAILFFLNYNRNYTLDCFMPIYNDQPSLSEAKTVRDIDKAACLPPLKLQKQLKNLNQNEIEAIKRKAYRSANWTEEYGFGIQKDGMPIIRIDFAPYAKEPIAEGVIVSGATRRPTAKKPAAKKPAAKKPAAKKPAAIKAIAKKPAAKKPMAKKLVMKKPAAIKAMAKKTAARKAMAKKPAMRKPAAIKARAKKPAARKAMAKKPAAMKAMAKR
jgi:flagellar biosynthesis GTPase FlhF